MSQKDFLADPDSAKNQTKISEHVDVDAQTSNSDGIPQKFSAEQERKFRANIARYYDEDTAKIIMEARAQAHKDLKEGHVKYSAEDVSPEFYTDKEMTEDTSLKKAYDDWEKKQKRQAKREQRQAPDRYGFKHWQKIAAAVLLMIVVLTSVTMSTEALRVPIVNFFSSSKPGYNMVVVETENGEGNYHKYIENVYVLGETLDGYEEISRTDGKRLILIEYADNKQGFYAYNQMVDDIDNWVDNNDTSYEKCEVLDSFGYFQSKETNSLIWAYDGYIFRLSGTISKEDMILLANSLALE